MTPCRHCGHPRPCRPRGLCWTCYYTPGVRQRYSPTSPYAGRLEVRDDPPRDHDGDARPYQPRPLPAAPTDTEPGTSARVLVLAARAARGESLWHPGDRRDCEGMTGHPQCDSGEPDRNRGPLEARGELPDDREPVVRRCRLRGRGVA